MTQAEPTLQSMFFEGEPKGKAGSLLPMDQLSEARQEFKRQLPKAAWALVQKELQKKMEEILGTRVSEILGAAWGKYEELCEYADPAKHPPEETALVPLARHTIRSAHSPHIDILIREVSIGTIGVDVELALELEGVILRVQGGRILAAQAGSLQGDGSLECTFRRGELTKSILKMDKSIPKLTLDRELGFEKGIPIPARPAALGPAPAEEA